jgi:hypothetical protein
MRIPRFSLPARPFTLPITALLAFAGVAQASTCSITPASTTEDTRTTSGLVIASTDGLTTHHQITGLKGGKLYQNNGTTVIANDAFITVAEGAVGLKFTPNANAHDLNTPAGFGFTVQAATGANGADLRREPVAAAVTESWSVNASVRYDISPDLSGQVGMAPINLDLGGFTAMVGLGWRF